MSIQIAYYENKAVVSGTFGRWFLGIYCLRCNNLVNLPKGYKGEPFEEAKNQCDFCELTITWKIRHQRDGGKGGGR